MVIMNKETKISRDNLNDNKSSDDDDNNNGGSSSSRISSSSAHKPAHNSDSINRALERAISDEQFLNSAIKLLLKDDDDRRRMQFPAFKKNILDHVRAITKDTDIISLFESLDGYIKFKDAYHVQKALEENIPAKKTAHQITDKTREHPNTRTRNNTDSSRSSTIKERGEAVNNKSEERKDYPEVTPTAMSEYICNVCGKLFQTRDDLVHHQHFETEEMKKNNKK